MATMTEDDARKRWCPFVRHTSGGEPDGAGNRCGPAPHHPAAWNSCIASECMAWRWEVKLVDNPINHGFMSVYPRPEPIYERTGKGYCGAAGQP